MFEREREEPRDDGVVHERVMDNEREDFCVYYECTLASYLA